MQDAVEVKEDDKFLEDVGNASPRTGSENESVLMKVILPQKLCYQHSVVSKGIQNAKIKLRMIFMFYLLATD